MKDDRPLGFVGKLATIYPFYKVKGQSIVDLTDAIKAATYEVKADIPESFANLGSMIPYVVGLMHSIRSDNHSMVRVAWENDDIYLIKDKLELPFGNVREADPDWDRINEYYEWALTDGVTSRLGSLELYNALILASFRYKDFARSMWEDFCDDFWTWQARLSFDNAIKTLPMLVPDEKLEYHWLLARVDYLNIEISKYCSVGKIATGSLAWEVAGKMLSTFRMLKPPAGPSEVEPVHSVVEKKPPRSLKPRGSKESSKQPKNRKEKTK